MSEDKSVAITEIMSGGRAAAREYLRAANMSRS